MPTGLDDDQLFSLLGSTRNDEEPEKVACTRAALAVCTGMSPPSRLGFPNVMRTVREYLIDCARISEVVVLVTDVWSPRHVEEHLRDVLAHQRQGRFVVPHLVSGRRLLRLDWS